MREIVEPELAVVAVADIRRAAFLQHLNPEVCVIWRRCPTEIGLCVAHRGCHLVNCGASVQVGAKESGMLCFSFNDILLDDATIDNIIKNKDDGHSEGVYESLMRTMPNCSLCPCLAKCQNFKNEVDSLIWFDDNFGEALINVRIQKNIWNSPLSFHKKVMMGSYRFFHNNRLTFILIILSWFVLDGIVSWILKKE